MVGFSKHYKNTIKHYKNTSFESPSMSSPKSGANEAERSRRGESKAQPLTRPLAEHYELDVKTWGDNQEFTSNGIQCEARRGYTGTWIIYVNIPGNPTKIPEIKELEKLGFKMCRIEKLVATCHLLVVYDDSYICGMSEEGKKHYGFPAASELADKCTEIIHEWIQLQKGFIPVYMLVGRSILKDKNEDHPEFILGIYKTKKEGQEALHNQDGGVEKSTLNVVKRFVHKSYSFE